MSDEKVINSSKIAIPLKYIEIKEENEVHSHNNITSYIDGKNFKIIDQKIAIEEIQPNLKSSVAIESESEMNEIIKPDSSCCTRCSSCSNEIKKTSPPKYDHNETKANKTLACVEYKPNLIVPLLTPLSSSSVPLLSSATINEQTMKKIDMQALQRNENRKTSNELIAKYLKTIEIPTIATGKNLNGDQNCIEIVTEYKNNLDMNGTNSRSNDELIKLDVTASVESESEEDDELKPLMTDNHTPMETSNVQPEFPNYGTVDPHYFANENSMATFPTESYPQFAKKNDSYSSTDSEESLIYDNRQKFFLSSVNNGKISPDTSEKILMRSTKFDDESINGNFENDLENIIKEIDTLDPSDIPNDRLCEDITEQVEFYFSNDSILKDAFLLKHVRRNKEGFVSLKLVSSFKRVRQFTKDWRVVGHAIRRKSRKTELNDVATKVRRIDPLPNFDETMPSRTIVACDLPMEKLSIEKVSDIFKRCGEIALIRILKPGMAIPVDVRQFMNKYPEMQQKDCALVEFIESTSARIAKNLPGSFQVFDMVAPKKKTGKKAAGPVTKLIENAYNKYHENNNYERNRGGSFSMMNTEGFDLRHKLRRNNSEYYVKNDHQSAYHQSIHHQHSHPSFHSSQLYQQYPTNSSPPIIQPRSNSFAFSNNNNHENISNNVNSAFNHYASSPRRFSSSSVSTADVVSNNNNNNNVNNNGTLRRHSTCSDYSSCSETSRRASFCSNSEGSRRNSLCSDQQCPCTRRLSQCSEVYRKMSHGSETNRRFSNGSFSFERSYSNPNEAMLSRRISNDSNFERKMSNGSIGNNSNSGSFEHYHNQRKFTNGFDPNRKLSNSDHYYIGGRRFSNDSAYDRRNSFGSDFEMGSPRSRTGSLLINQFKNGESVVRTPIGPDGSKGFNSRNRKLGQIVPPVN